LKDNRAGQRPTAITVCSICILLLAGGLASCGRNAAEDLVNCSIDTGACSAYAGDKKVRVLFEISPRPVLSMKRLLFSVRLDEDGEGITDAAVQAELLMPGMTMAGNVLKLTHAGNGTYIGEGVIVRCSTGRKVWQADITADRPSGEGRRIAKTSFVFKVGK